MIGLRMKMVASFGASAAICAAALAQSGGARKDVDAALARFVKHPTHCAQLFGGDAYGDTVSDQWSRDLAATMRGGLAEAPAELARVQQACRQELEARARAPGPQAAAQSK
jgi:hypothetical protein